MKNEKGYFGLKNKVIIVTGATGILGQSFVNGLNDMEACVALLGRNEEIGEERSADMNKNGGDALFIKTDVLSKKELENARDIILQKWDRIDGLVNGAGGNIPEAIIAPDADVFDIDMDALKKAFDLNLYGGAGRHFDLAVERCFKIC